jgi:hypothetical protein
VTSTSRRCARTGPRNGDECRRCIYNRSDGQPFEPLVNIHRGRRDEIERVNCLMFRDRPPAEAWRGMALIDVERDDTE